jgi:hypothetical protein
MAKTKTAGFFFKATPEEMEWIEKRMEQTGCSNKSAYLRKIAIDGHVINLDLPGLNEIGRLLRVTANNVNQIAKRVNGGGEAHRADVAEINTQLAAIRTDFGRLLTSLSELTNPKPGKRFVKPLTWRDLPGYNPLTGDMELTGGAAITGDA